jgi:hypothetical protein
MALWFPRSVTVQIINPGQGTALSHWLSWLWRSERSASKISDQDAIIRTMRWAGAGPMIEVPMMSSRCRPPIFLEELEQMNKIIIVSAAILGPSTSAALAAKTRHAKKPDATPAASTYPARRISST